MSDELVERAMNVHDDISKEDGSRAAMRAAIAVIREHVIEKCVREAEKQVVDGDWFRVRTAREIAAAIRALKEKTP